MSAGRIRARIEIAGRVQGVGFRPFVYRAARRGGLRGFVRNTPRGVQVQVEGAPERVRGFLDQMVRDPPRLARVERLRVRYLRPRGDPAFLILDSRIAGYRAAPATPDAATCPACLAELFDPRDRRYRYPFINCTGCGPRLTILLDIPYDRPHTTMRTFRMCGRCEAEYHDPASRRFHAQPNACPECGPRLELLDPSGARVAAGEQALRLAERRVAGGGIVALKGLGGFQLLCDARSEPAVMRLRERKRREEKPLALLVDSLETARALCVLDAQEEAALAGPESPILLARRRAEAPVARAVAPGNRRLGVMVAYTPLHHLIARDLGFPLVATSGNLSDDPIARDNAEALARLGGVADLFLVHDRPVARRVDDSVGRVTGGAFRVLRCARGLAPRAVRLPRPLPAVLAVGAHLKSVVGIAVGDQVVLSPHLGDLDTPRAREGFAQAVGDLMRLYRFTPALVACDLHPDYASTRFAEGLGLPVAQVQHHHAHAASCLADAGEWDGKEAFALTWDGSGCGPDGTVWGGELLRLDGGCFRRVAHLLPFRLPGGEAAVREPRRAAFAVLWETFGEDGLDRAAPPALRGAFGAAEAELLRRMLRRRVNCPVTTSMGRLFDAVAALAGLRQRASFEGQAAMELEQALDPAEEGAYPLALADGDPLVLDWRPMVEALVAEVRAGASPAAASARFHNGIARGAAAVAERVGAGRIALSGGCFQNEALTEKVRVRLEARGVRVLLHRQVPPNDGGIALGQVAVAAAGVAGSRR